MFYEDILISFDNKLSDVHVKKAFTNNIISYITKEGYYLAGMIVFLSFRMGRHYFERSCCLPSVPADGFAL